MKELLRNQSIKPYIRRTVSLICFFAVFLYVFVSVTYLFRGDIDSRRNVVGIKEEEPLDMIYIGGSAAYCYWEPLKAWNDCGFTSYNVATSGIEAESILYYMKQSLKYQSPGLFVVGVRAFEYYSSEGSESGIRRTSDALDFWDIDRFRFIRTYLRNRTMDMDKWSLYLDIMKYHTNYEALSSPDAWKLIDNSDRQPYKGCRLQTSYYYLDEPGAFQTENRAALSQGASDTLYELLDFCKEKDVDVLFVISPYRITEADYEKYNTIKDVVTSYGYGFLNSNDYYEEMDFDFSEDFSDRSHVNDLGAEKYTEFLENYIVENYALPDHRGEGEYKSWDELYTQFASAREAGKASIRNMITSAQEGEIIAGELYEAIDDLAAWCDLVNDRRFTVFAVGDGTSLDAMSYIDTKALEAMGLAKLEDDNYIRILCNAQILYANENSDEEGCEINIGAQQEISCLIDNEDRQLSVIIDGEDYSRKDSEGINIVVFENDYRYAVDSFTIKCDINGKTTFVR